MLALQRPVPRTYKQAYFGLPYGKMSISLLKTVTDANAPATTLDAMNCHKR
ncbi:hypothetical protein A2U01_0107080, partial [Trifolium medium]|nr:hypothetical protein [Trifolium medium]